MSSLSVLSLQSLKWLDLKDNPLDPALAKVAGDCLDEKQCKQCANKVSTELPGASPAQSPGTRCCLLLFLPLLGHL